MVAVVFGVGICGVTVDLPHCRRGVGGEVRILLAGRRTAGAGRFDQGGVEVTIGIGFCRIEKLDRNFVIAGLQKRRIDGEIV